MENSVFMQQDAITVKDLYIEYKSLNAFSIQKNLFRFRKQKNDTFQAVRGVSFSVKEGEILGIIGRNGSGKSTMLKAIAGVFCADKGKIDLHDHSVSLLSLGVGFQVEMTGRENIMLSGMLMGFSEEYVREKIPDIVKFADLGEFIDYPVKTYSSGMFSKLGFAITVILETDIFLIDEVLSVGDEQFQRKSFSKMQSLINSKDRTVVIVSHDIEALKALCNRVLWMNEGKIMKLGDTDEVLAEYIEYMRQEG